ncbi:MAG: hypothetical protein IJ995_00115 [Clostridia bacterium]|nr:hypothetical protein [Clostridia bacterium]
MEIFAKIARLKDMISLRRAIILKIISRGTTQIASKGCPSGSIKPYAFTQQYGKVLLGAKNRSFLPFCSEATNIKVFPLRLAPTAASLLWKGIVDILLRQRLFY